MSHSPRRVTLFAGLGCLILFLFASTVGRKEIATQYHLFRLRRDPAYFRGTLDQPEGTPRRVAVRKYLESDEGKRALITRCFPSTRRMSSEAFTAERTSHVYVDVGFEYVVLRTGSAKEVWQDVLVRHLELIDEYVTSGFTFTLPEYQGVQFELRKGREPRAIKQPASPKRSRI